MSRHRTPEQAHAAAVADARALLRVLEKQLAREEAAVKTWPAVGSMGRVVELLERAAMGAYLVGNVDEADALQKLRHDVAVEGGSA